MQIVVTRNAASDVHYSATDDIRRSATVAATGDLLLPLMKSNPTGLLRTVNKRLKSSRCPVEQSLIPSRYRQVQSSSRIIDVIVRVTDLGKDVGSAADP
jgi:hypothetical protein